MVDNIKIEKIEDYILVVLSDKTITPKRAHEILSVIGKESIRLNCNKVLLDERSVERREVPPPKIMELSEYMNKEGIGNIQIAFLCKNKLIDNDAVLLRSFAFNNKFMTQFFSDRNEAIAWLKNKSTT